MPHSVHPTPRENTPDPRADQDVSTPWWNVNQPEEKWTPECPAYLLGQSEKNMGILMKRDDEFIRPTWKKCQDLIRTNKIHCFQRSSSQLRGYLEYVHNLKKTYGSVLSYIQQDRLHWETITPSGDIPFSNTSDYKILHNDWPYFIEEGIKHLVVWTKFIIEEDKTTGEVTKEANEQIDNFIKRVLCEGRDGKTIERQNIVWFKNWKSLKSIHSLEHFHLMLYEAPEELLEVVTGGDRPTCESWMQSKS